MTKRAWKYWEPTFQADKVCEMNPVWPWGGHRRFAYDLVRWMRPGRIAELGVHWGTSFFTFAQAIKDGRMRDTELVGVDTFEGEEHAGKYGSEVLDTVRRIVKSSFPKQSITLHQMFFAEALPLVEDGSVDLLHIDGLHTFEAVKEDFETWLPKLAPEGVMLFHDVAPDTGYGSTEYWNQLCKEYPGFAFEHSWGLGVLFPKGDARLLKLRAEGLEDKLITYPALASAERSAIELRDVGRMAKDRMETIRKQSRTNAELRERAEKAEKLARERQETVGQQSEKIRARDERIEKQRSDLESAKTLAKDRYEVIQRQSAIIAQRDETITTLDNRFATLDKRFAAVQASRDELRERVKKLEAHQSQLGQRVAEVLEREAQARETLAAKNALVEQLRAQMQDAAHDRQRMEAMFADMATHLSALASSHANDRRRTGERFDALGEAVERSRRSSEVAAKAFRDRLAQLEVDAELQSVRSEHLEAIVAAQREQRLMVASGRSVEVDWLTGEPQA